jgi:MFS family permease
MSLDRPTRNVLLLALCQGLAMTGNAVVMTVSALAGYMLAEDKSLATLPLALQFTATMAATIPASLLMKQIGRRAGFSLGVLVAAAGGAVSSFAIFTANFPLFCLGAAIYGGFNGFALFYRFAAADMASDAFRGKAISLVVTGGVLAAFAGPELAIWSRGWFEPTVFAGCYAAIVGLALAALLLLQLIKIPRPAPEERRQGGRPLGTIMRQPEFVVAALGGMIGYGTMSLVMTATPLAMQAHALEIGDIGFVIQWHILGMYAPGFVTGHLIHRFGVLNVMLAGVVFAVGCVAVNLTGVGILQFWMALVLLGVGWNFLFVGSTTLLTECYTPVEKAKTQAINDFLVFGAVALCSFSSGALQHGFGWQAVNLGVVAPLLVAVTATLWLKRRRATATA